MNILDIIEKSPIGKISFTHDIKTDDIQCNEIVFGDTTYDKSRPSELDKYKKDGDIEFSSFEPYFVENDKHFGLFDVNEYSYIVSQVIVIPELSVAKFYNIIRKNTCD